MLNRKNHHHPRLSRSYNSLLKYLFSDEDNNKLVEIEGLQMLLNLKQIHFGYNRLKKISNIGHLKKLREAYLYVNRISAI